MTTISGQRIRGVAGAPGVTHGPYVRFERAPLPPSDGLASDPAAEVVRVRAAAETIAKSRERLAEDLRRSGHANEARIFDAHAEIARDPAIIDDATDRIVRQHATASAAIVAAASTVAEQLRGLRDETLAGRASDVLDVGDRIAREVVGLPPAAVDLGRPSVVVADDLPPSVTAGLPRELLLGIVLERASPTAHAVILARAYGIPAVVGAAGLRDALHAAGDGAELALDGATGEVIVSPDAATIATFDERARQVDRGRVRALADAALPAETSDGTSVELLANIGSPREAGPARAQGATGVGLFRTEFLFLERRTEPTEDEQAQAYGDVAAAFAPHPVTVRLLDAGGDKPIEYLPIAPEANPFLGVRALRLAKARPALFVTQLRACYRAAARGRVRVMAPMVADAGDCDVFLDLARDARAGLDRDGVSRGDVELGVMLEIPSAVLSADAYFAKIAFVSLGTNDLLQYTMAADRGNASLERYHDALHPAHLALIRAAVDAARRHRVSLSVCGEMAADPVAACALVGLGVRSLSLVPSAIAAVKRTIRGASLTDLEDAALAAVADDGAGRVRERLGAVLSGAG